MAMASAALWLVLFGVLHGLTHMTVISLFGIAPLIVATVADEGRTAIFAGAAVALAVGIGAWYGNAADGVYWTRAAVVCAIGAMAVVVAGIRRRREERLARMTAIAQASQLALLPPLPPEMTGISIAARYRSATSEASAGGERVPAQRGRRARDGAGGLRGRPGHHAAPGRGGLRHGGAGPGHLVRRAHHCQLRPSPAAAAPTRRPAAAGRGDDG